MTKISRVAPRNPNSHTLTIGEGNNKKYPSYPLETIGAAVRNILILALVFFLPVSAIAASLDSAGIAEVEHLLIHLKESNCQFNRNGSWYPADKASEHLRSKYEYFLGKGQLDSVESFIDKAASASSVTGKAYLVLCPGHAVEESSGWLRQELGRYRKENLVRK